MTERRRTILTDEDRREIAHEVASVIMQVQKEAPARVLTEKQIEWVEGAIQEQADRAKMRKAFIEKSFMACVWGAVMFIGYLVLDWARHGFKNLTP